MLSQTNLIFKSGWSKLINTRERVISSHLSSSRHQQVWYLTKGATPLQLSQRNSSESALGLGYLLHRVICVFTTTYVIYIWGPKSSHLILCKAETWDITHITLATRAMHENMGAHRKRNAVLNLMTQSRTLPLFSTVCPRAFSFPNFILIEFLLEPRL